MSVVAVTSTHAKAALGDAKGVIPSQERVTAHLTNGDLTVTWS